MIFIGSSKFEVAAAQIYWDRYCVVYGRVCQIVMGRYTVKQSNLIDLKMNVNFIDLKMNVVM